MRYPKELIELYKGLEFPTLLSVIIDIITLLDRETDITKRKALIKRVALPMRVHIKYCSTKRDELLQYAIDNNISIDLSYDGMNIIPTVK